MMRTSPRETHHGAARNDVRPSGAQRHRACLREVALRVARWMINDPCTFAAPDHPHRRRVDPLRAAPLVALHAACALVVVVGVSPAALWVCAALYVSRMFFITAFYHRYFSHRAYRASRAVTLAMAMVSAPDGVSARAPSEPRTAATAAAVSPLACRTARSRQGLVRPRNPCAAAIAAVAMRRVAPPDPGCPVTSLIGHADPDKGARAGDRRGLRVSCRDRPYVSPRPFSRSLIRSRASSRSAATLSIRLENCREK